VRSFILLAGFTSFACSNPTDMHSTITASDAPQDAGAVRIQPVHHSALELEWNGMVVYVDPHDGSRRFKAFKAPDVILITDIHGDHLDTATLRGLDLNKARIIAPKAVVDLLPSGLKAKATILANGARMEANGIGIEAVPMYNMPDLNDPRHPKGRGNGYILTMGDERIYISGDTEDIPEMRALKDIDVAFVCMNLPYTMTVEQAANGVLAFKPRVVYPYHYRGKEGFSDVGRFKELVNAGDPAIEVRLVDWYKE
jgi:L-ascorbate metabolism protein UlaG (beta-lactamase superfamily)